jgi:prepilin-type N-terminal cleavage/methylation domain-containing protein
VGLSLKRAFSLIEILVVALIILILAAFLLPRYLGDIKDEHNKRVKSPIKQARGVECQSNLQQIRQAYTMATSFGETRPQSLADLRSNGVTESITVCPVSKKPYQFDPASGRAWCTEPGHERF